MKLTSMLAAIGLTALSFSVHAADDHAHWGYEGHAGPTHWNELEPGFAGCKLGKQQSPIDIRGAKQAKLAPIVFNYAASTANVVNNGHTIQVNLASGGSIKLPDGEYKLIQFHFHTPSEEKIEGESFPLVAHFVHKSDAGKLAVVAVLFKLGAANTALNAVFDNLPATAGETKTLGGTIDPTEILPAKRSYYGFMGSLTTPPCSEDVRWQVLKQTVTLSVAQFAEFRKLYSMNARPVQGLNGRQVKASD